MRRISWGLETIIILLVLLTATVIAAQENADSGVVIHLYYEDQAPDRLDSSLFPRNVCLEAVIQLNPDLDINNVPYGERILMPKDELCYQYNKELPGWGNFGEGYPPRLKYYEDGQWLAEPYYSDQVIYLRPSTTLEAIAEAFNICEDQLLADNILLQHMERYQAYAEFSIDVFIPQDAPLCDPTQPRPVISDSPFNYRHWEIANRVTAIPRDQLTPFYLSSHYNICPEELQRDSYNVIIPNTYSDSSNSDETILVALPNDAQSCYNEQGQRLRYFDDDGNRLEPPQYSDLDTILVLPGSTIEGIAAQHDVCLIDFLRVNHFMQLPNALPVEMFLPPQRDTCPDDVEVYQLEKVNNRSETLNQVSIEKNICPEAIAEINPHVIQTDRRYSFRWDSYPGLEFVYERRAYYSDSSTAGRMILLPTEAQACYTQYEKQEDESRFDTERRINRCYEEFIDYDETFYVRNDAPPCYNESGQRLAYPSDAYLTRLDETYSREDLAYQDMAIHIFQRDDNLYRISQAYNVCVEDLLAANPNLVGKMPFGYPTFIPNTRPCYDEDSGQQLIYEDENGDALEEPRVSDELMYYGNQPLGRIAHYYNVCENRIEDANTDKVGNLSTYLGWIIPTDRPDCFDDAGDLINYVCYDEPVDMTIDYHIDYHNEDNFPTINPDGTNCYDLAASDTRIWYEGEAYQIMNYGEEDILASRAFTAWCYGISLDAIDAINDEQSLLNLLPVRHRLIPEATRECYIDHPELLDYATVHQVEQGETLHSIARQYDILPQWIAKANDLNDDNMIWNQQLLIIPDGTRPSHIFAIFMSVVALFTSALLFYRLRRLPTRKKKRKTTGHSCLMCLFRPQQRW